MKLTFFMIAVLAASLGLACARADVKPANEGRPTPVPTASVPRNADYPGRGKVTKINSELGTVELDHEAIPEAMPYAMKMEFFVSDKAMLKTIKVGDQVDFTLRYKDGQETVIAIKKAQ